MSLEAFQNLYKQINLDVDEMIDEQKVIQLVDLTRFIEAYGQPLDFEDSDPSGMNIVKSKQQKIGIYFHDFSDDNASIIKNDLPSFRTNNEIDEFWLVMVQTQSTNHFKNYIQLIESEDINSFYEKVYLFDFFNAKILQLS